MLTLVGDFGGTNCRLGLARAGRLMAGSHSSYRNADFASPWQVMEHYLSEQSVPRVEAACLGVAGPVREGRVTLTNYPWALEDSRIRQVTGAGRVTLLNDLQAQGYALHGLASEELVQVIPGDPVPQAPRLIIAIGTGVNAAVAHCTTGGIFVPPSESGHMALPLMDETDLAFAADLRRELGHQPVEAALSGGGLARLWAFFGGPQGASGQEVTRAFEQGNPSAQDALRRFTLYLARYAADLALIHLPMGGIYLAGSVGLAVASYLNALGFAKAFCRPGPYADIHRAIPIYAVPDRPLTQEGCAIRMAQDTLPGISEDL